MSTRTPGQVRTASNRWTRPITLVSKVDGWLAVAAAHQRLCGKVKHDFGPQRIQQRAHGMRIAQIRPVVG